MRPPFTTLILHTWKEHGKPKPWKKIFADTEDDEQVDNEVGRGKNKTPEMVAASRPTLRKVVRSTSLDELSSRSSFPCRRALEHREDSGHFSFLPKSQSFTEGLSCTLKESQLVVPGKRSPSLKSIESSFEKSSPLLGVARRSRSFHESLTAKKDCCLNKPPCYSPCFGNEAEWRKPSSEETRLEYRKTRLHNFHTISFAQSVGPNV